MSVITWASPWDANFVAGGFGGGEGTVSLRSKSPLPPPLLPYILSRVWLKTHFAFSCASQTASFSLI